MTGERTPDAIAAEFLSSLRGDGNADPSGDALGAADTTAQTDEGDSGDPTDPFAENPSDMPDVAALKRQLRGTMTRRTQEIAEEKRKIAEERAQYQEAVRDAQLLRALRESPNPTEAAKALLGGGGNGGGGDEFSATLKELEAEFDPKTLQGMLKLFNAAYRQNVSRDFSQPLTGLQALLGDRVNNQWRDVVSEFGPEANEFKDAALKMQQQTGLSARECAILASDGMLKVNQFRAKVLDAKKRSATALSVPEGSVKPDRIALTRDARNKRIMAAAAASGLDRLARP